MSRVLFYLFLSLCVIPVSANSVRTENTTSISTLELKDFNANPAPVKNLMNHALDLAAQNLGYLYSSADPSNGGMDCSGTIYYLLRKVGITDVPRSSDLIYQWAVEKGHFYPVTKYDFASLEFSHLQPGDLLFWNGTYEIKRAIDVTHVMIYLGKNKNGEPLMFGSSDGRTYKGKKVYGVSVFDFLLPNELKKSKFLGYSCTPTINCLK